MTTLYHGSYAEVSSPLVKLGRAKVDFGQGFYLTLLKAQAESWAKTIKLLWTNTSHSFHLPL